MVLNYLSSLDFRVLVQKGEFSTKSFNYHERTFFLACFGLMHGRRLQKSRLFLEK